MRTTRAIGLLRRGAAVSAFTVALASLGACAGAQWQPAPCPHCTDVKYPAGGSHSRVPGQAGEPDTREDGTATAEEAEAFMADTETELRRLWVRRERAGWVASNFITDDTETISAEADQEAMEYLAQAIKQATRFDGLDLEPELRRKFRLLKTAGTVPAPANQALTEELSKVSSAMASTYGKAKYCPPPKSGLRVAIEKNKELQKSFKEKLACTPGEGGLGINDLTTVMADVRDEPALREAWLGWHATSRSMRTQFARYAELGNMGAKEIGFSDVGEMWRAGYDMSPDAFRADIERLWQQMKPFYEELHCYVRSALAKQYGALVHDGEPIPAHLLGNMWSQSWGNIFPLVEPYKGASLPDVTQQMKLQKWDELRMVRTAEGFFTSLGLAPLPKTFWERSLFKQPRDRDVECHASAWDVSYANDLRIKMCIKITDEELDVVHHELGHDYYYQQYYKLPILFQQGANDGFHEAIGDTIALSVTPGYLKEIGLLKQVPKNDKATINYLMKMAVDKISFLPFGKLIDEWRWDVFSGRVKPENYNQAWWELRRKYQGIAPPEPRSEADFDPGAKYHVPASVPYIRYFLAYVYQFQFHRALCRAAGFTGPLHECSIYGNKAAGEKLRALLAMGASKPWQDALYAMTGEKQADAGALLEYFGPVRAFLREKIQGQKCGW